MSPTWPQYVNPTHCKQGRGKRKYCYRLLILYLNLAVSKYRCPCFQWDISYSRGQYSFPFVLMFCIWSLSLYGRHCNVIFTQSKIIHIYDKSNHINIPCVKLSRDVRFFGMYLKLNTNIRASPQPYLLLILCHTFGIKGHRHRTPRFVTL